MNGHHEDLIARPEQTPEALRAALALLAPDRLPEMQEALDSAVLQAIEQRSVTPLRAWLLTWAQDIEIARRPDLVSRHRDAMARLHADDSTAFSAKEAADDLSVALGEAAKAVRS